MISLTQLQLETWLATLLWPFCRIAAMAMTAPIFSHQAIPARLKISFVLLVTLAVGPALPPPPPGSLNFPQAYLILLQQLLIGAGMGFAMRLVFAALEMAGDLIGLQMGLSFAMFIDPQSANQSPLVGSFLGTLALLVFLAIGGHAYLIAGVTDSFVAFPVAPLSKAPFSLAVMSVWGREMFGIGLHVAMPILAAMLVCNLGLGVLVRAAPQLNLMSVGFPVTLWLGFTVLIGSLPMLGPVLQSAIETGLRLALGR